MKNKLADLLLTKENTATMDVLLSMHDLWLDSEDIAEVSHNTVDEVYEYLMFLLERNIIKESDEETYQLDQRHPLAQRLLLFRQDFVPDSIQQGEQATIGSLTKLEKVTRFELIINGMRKYNTWNAEEILASLQDAGRTLKVFIREGEKPHG